MKYASRFHHTVCEIKEIGSQNQKRKANAQNRIYDTDTLWSQEARNLETKFEKKALKALALEQSLTLTCKRGRENQSSGWKSLDFDTHNSIDLSTAIYLADFNIRDSYDMWHIFLSAKENQILMSKWVITWVHLMPHSNNFLCKYSVYVIYT